MSADEQPRIIRTPIAKNLSFPVGYELLRDNFCHLPHWQKTRFYFSAHPTTFATEFNDILRDKIPYRILRLEFRPKMQRGYDHILSGWSFDVYPVFRTLKHAAQSVLKGDVFERLREFVSSMPLEPSFYTRRDIVFDPVSGTCEIKSFSK